jgi:hypothetical protein
MGQALKVEGERLVWRTHRNERDVGATREQVTIRDGWFGVQ